MTTTILIHNGHRAVDVENVDRVYDHDKDVMTDEWKSAGVVTIQPGTLYQTYCTDTRKVVVHEPPIKTE